MLGGKHEGKVSEKPKKPHYAAALYSADRKIELTPIDVADARYEDEACALGTKRAREWLTENGIDRAFLQLVKDGRGIGTLEVAA